MKLRLRADTLRLRLTASEVDRISRGEGVVEQVPLPPDCTFSYSLQPSVVSAVELRYVEGEIAVLLPHESARRWAESDEVGVYADVATARAVLHVSIEKDFRCRTLRQESEDRGALGHSDKPEVC